MPKTKDPIIIPATAAALMPVLFICEAAFVCEVAAEELGGGPFPSSGT